MERDLNTVEKILNWDSRWNAYYSMPPRSERGDFVQIRTNINPNNIHLTQEEKLQAINIIISELDKKVHYHDDLDALIKELLAKESKTDMDNYIIFHLENIYNGRLTPTIRARKK